MLLDHLRIKEQITVMGAIFRDIEKRYLSEEIPTQEDPTSSQTICGIAALCSSVITNRTHLESQVTDWLSKGQDGSIQNVGLRRALLVNFADRTGEQTNPSVNTATNN